MPFVSQFPWLASPLAEIDAFSGCDLEEVPVSNVASEPIGSPLHPKE